MLSGTAAGEDAEGTVAACLAAVAPDDFGAEALTPEAAGKRAAILVEWLALGDGLEGFAQVIEFGDFVDFGLCFIVHIDLMFAVYV